MEPVKQNGNSLINQISAGVFRTWLGAVAFSLIALPFGLTFATAPLILAAGCLVSGAVCQVAGPPLVRKAVSGFRQLMGKDAAAAPSAKKKALPPIPVPEGHVDIRGIDKAELLAALYNGTRPLNMGFVLEERSPMTPDEARLLLAEGTTWFERVKDQPLKTSLSGDVALAALYDTGAYPGAFADIVTGIRAGRTAAARGIQSTDKDRDASGERETTMSIGDQRKMDIDEIAAAIVADFNKAAGLKKKGIAPRDPRGPGGGGGVSPASPRMPGAAAR